MKNKTGKIVGFVLGLTGWLIFFKVVFLPRIAPADELAPGIVVLAGILNGVLFGFLGHLVQNYFDAQKKVGL